MFNEVIKKLLAQIEILPENVLVIYLMKKFPTLSENMARQSIHAACRSRACYRIGDNIGRTRFSEMDSNFMKKAQALRVMLEISPDGEFVIGTHPWLLVFTKGSKMVQVCYIEHDMELVSSMIIAEKPIPEEERAAIRRIAIIDPTCDVDKIKAAGFSHFCTVDPTTFKLHIVRKCDPETAWSDVPEKA